MRAIWWQSSARYAQGGGTRLGAAEEELRQPEDSIRCQTGSHRAPSDCSGRRWGQNT